MWETQRKEADTNKAQNYKEAKGCDPGWLHHETENGKTKQAQDDHKAQASKRQES